MDAPFFSGIISRRASSLLVRRGFERLAGKSEDGAFYLTQAMGGGKTHSLIAFGLLAADPALRREIVPKLASGAEFGAAKVVIFNGHQNPDTLLWGFIADQLGRGDAMAPFWRNGAKTPGIDEWVSVLGDQPVLILLDELPSYLQMAQGEPVGATTLGDLTIGALERLFNALPRCPRACVVVTNLKDDVYLDGSGQLRTLIENLTKHYDRNAQAITPVQQNTGEVFAIVRKRLFDGLPPPDRVDEIAQAYVAALQKAKRIDTIPTTPETFIERIRETYPFHPSICDIVARFAFNRGYQKTRALIPAAAACGTRRDGHERQCFPHRPASPRFQRSGHPGRKFARSTPPMVRRFPMTSPIAATRSPRRSTPPTAIPPHPPSPR